MANYYVDATGGNDAWPGTIGQPWQTCAKVTTEIGLGTFTGGDGIFFKRGETWTITGAANCVRFAGSSGSLGNHIYVGPYGSGNRPKFDAAAWFWEGLFFRDVGDAAGNYWTVEGLEFTDYPGAAGVWIGGAHHFYLIDLYVHDTQINANWKAGIRVADNSENIWIWDCEIDAIDYGEGIYVGTGLDVTDRSRRTFINNCSISNCEHEGIDLKVGSVECFVYNSEFEFNGYGVDQSHIAMGGRYHHVYNCRFSGTTGNHRQAIYMSQYTQGGYDSGYNTVERCLFKNETGARGGIDMVFNDNVVTNCTFVDCSIGIYGQAGGAASNIIKNNIFKGMSSYEIYLTAAAANYVCDYNNYSDDGVGNIWYEGGAGRTLAHVQGVLGQELNANTNDADFADTTDYNLNPTSTLLNDGQASATHYDYNQEYMAVGAPDMGWMEFNWVRPHRVFKSLIEDTSLSRFTGYTGVTADEDTVYADDYSLRVNITNTDDRYAYRTGLGNIAHFYADFQINVNNLTMGAGDSFVIWQGRTAGNVALCYVWLHYDGANIQVGGGLRDDADAWTDTGSFNLSPGWNWVQFYWSASPVVGTNEGEFVLWLNGTEEAHLSGKNNHDRTVDRFYIGAVTGLDATTSGDVYLDVPRMDEVRYMEEYDYSPSPPNGNGDGNGGGGGGGAGGRTDVLVCARPWRLIEPDPTTNLVLNPSGEAAGNFAAVGGGSMTRVTTYSLYGYNSYFLQTAAHNQGGSWTLQTLDNAAHYVTMRVRGTPPTHWTWSLGTGARTPTLVDVIDDDWLLYGAGFTATQSNGSTALYVRQLGAGAGNFHADGVQVEEKTYWTTLCMGNLEGCWWDGAENASTSTRSAQSRAGGRVRDFWEDYGFFVEESFGAGAAEVDVSTRGYALLPGDALTGVKTESRQFTLTGRFVAESERDLHANRQSLLKVLSATSYPDDAEGRQPVRVRYRGAEAQKQIEVHYEGGLEGRLKASYGDFQVESEAEWMRAARWTEAAAIRFKSPDPFWYQVGQDAVVLDTNDSDTMQCVVARLRSTGQWDNLSIDGVVGPAVVHSILIASDNSVYVGGAWTDWDNIVGCDTIARYIPSTDTWEIIGAASDVNNTVHDIVEAPNGDIYVVGDFTNVAGIGNADYVAMWDGTNWNAVGNPNQGTATIDSVNAAAFDHSGNLYVGGAFTDFANIANADGVAMWDGAAWNAVGAPALALGEPVNGVAIDRNDNVYVGGDFANLAGIGDADYIAMWDGTNWNAVGASGDPTGIVEDLTIANDGTLYIGGSFTNWAGITEADYIVLWNGTAYYALGSGMDNTVREMSVAPDGMLYAVGDFTIAGGITVAGYAAKWNGASWAHLDIALTGAPSVYAVTTGNQDPVVVSNYDVYLGCDVYGVTAYFAGSVIAANNGSQSAYPIIVVNRSGGTSAVLEEVRNETTGKELLFDYALLDGETLTIDLRPTQKNIVSDFFVLPRQDAVLANSDFGSFALQPGNNQVTCFVDVAGGPTVTAYMTWVTPYRSLD